MGLACRLSALGLLLSALLVCTRSQDQESVFAIVGEDFTFSPKVNGTIREITWMKRKNKAAEWEHDRLPMYYSSLAERGELETSSGNLTIKKLNTDDAAEYEAQVLPVGNDLLQYTKFVLEVLDPPSPSVLNCSVTNGQIRISCEIHFSKDVRYSWYQDDRKIMQANNPVLELKENADRPEKVLCVREVSKTKISDSISLSACFPERPESLSRGRDGLIAFFVIIIILLLFMGALFVLWKRGLLANILRWKPRKHSGYTPADPEYENPVAFEVAGHQSGEAAKSEEIQQDVQVSLQDSNESQAEKGSHKKEGNLFHTWTKKIRGNIDRVRSDQTHKTDEEKSSKETKSMNQPDLPSNQEKTEEEKNSKETESTSQADNSSNQEKTEEKKNSKESLSMSQADDSFNQETPDYENISDRNQEPEEKKNSKESLSTSQADNSSNQENPDLKLESEAD